MNRDETLVAKGAGSAVVLRGCEAAEVWKYIAYGYGDCISGGLFDFVLFLTLLLPLPSFPLPN